MLDFAFNAYSENSLNGWIAQSQLILEQSVACRAIVNCLWDAIGVARSKTQTIKRLRGCFSIHSTRHPNFSLCAAICKKNLAEETCISGIFPEEKMQ